MTTTVKAVYVSGVLRPLTPLELLEGQKVEVTVNAPLQKPPPDPRRVAEILAEIAAMSIESGGESFSGQDHDRILYGETEAR